MKKKVALAVAAGFLIGLLLWFFGLSDEFCRFNLFVGHLVGDAIGSLIR